MKHFSEQALTDFVRGIRPSETKGAIEAHLASGCVECVAGNGVWKKIYSIAANEPQFAPPDQAVRMAILGFAAVQTPQPDLWTAAKLVFDSLRQPLTVGVRSGASDSRQMMFDAEGTLVDMVLDTKTQSGTISLIGQVLDRRGARVAPREVAVILWTETGQPVMETFANQFGEFQMEFAPQARLRLSVEIAGRKTVRIPPINLNTEVMKPPVTDESKGHY